MSDLKDRMVSATFWKMGERVLSQGVSFIVSLILARILSPDNYGVVAVILIFINIADVLISSGFSASLIQKKEASNADFSTAFYCNLLLGIVLYVLLFFSAPLISLLYQMPMLTSYIRILALRLPIPSFQAIQVAYVSRKLLFKKFFFSTSGGTIFSGILGIILALHGFGVWSLIFQYLCMTIVDTLILFCTIHWHPSRSFSLKSAKELFSYGWKVMATDLSGTVFNNLGNFIIGLRYSTSDLAYYNKGNQIPGMLRSNIYTTLISVLFPGMSRVGDDKQAINRFISKSIRLLSYVLFPIMVGLFVSAKPITGILFSEKWFPMIPYMRIGCVEMMLSISGTVCLQAIKAMGYSSLMFKMEFIKKPIYILSVLLAIPFGVFAVALVIPINTLLELVLNGFVISKLTGYTLRQQFADCIPAFLLTAGMAAIILLLLFLPFNYYVIFVLQVIVGVLSYLVLSFVSNNDSFKFVFGYLKRLRK